MGARLAEEVAERRGGDEHGGEGRGGAGGAGGHCDVVVIPRVFCSSSPASVGKEGHRCEVIGALP